MNDSWLRTDPHRRWNPLLRDWVLVSPNRTQRPWQGEVAKAATRTAVHYDPKCYLCPGNVRANGEHNPKYEHTFAFTNDYAALLPETPHHAQDDDLLRAETERGTCRVVCFDPDHSLTLAGMTVAAIERVVAAWQLEMRALAAQPWVQHVQVFENRGAMMGASNPHPHCQIWATEHVPDQPLREQASLREFREEHGKCMLCEYVQRELQIGERVVCRNDHFAAVVPWWAVWPFEALVLPVEHCASLLELESPQSGALADILKKITARYDALFATSFPYTMGFHQALRSQPDSPEHLHVHFYPPLLRSATVRKFMVGFEMLAMPQRDITPETAAERLRNASNVANAAKATT